MRRSTGSRAIHHLKAPALEPFLYTLPRERAVTHAFRVASGLDSMVIGEPQILGQMKDAVKSAEHAGTLGTVLHQLFQSTFSVAKEVRTQTDIGASSVSMAAAAIKVAERIYPSIAGQKVLFVGAGEMIELCATHFAREAAARDDVRQPFNRTRRSSSPSRFQGRVITLNDLPEQLAQARHRGHLYGEHAADPRQGHDRTRDQDARAIARS